MDETTKWVIGISVTLVLFVVGFTGRIMYQGRKERENKIEQKLRVHFDDMKNKVINHISEMARSLTIRHERLVTNYAPIGESYPFAEEELYKCFELHFPEEAKEWKELNKKAVKFNEDVVSFFQKHEYTRSAIKQNTANRLINNLQQEFNDFAQRLARKVESIDKYEMGKQFKKHKECPICKKF